jgi:hypothetical protein
MVNDLLKVEDRVKTILTKYPETRDSDKLLWLAYNSIYNNLKNVLKDYSLFKRWLLNKNTPVFESLSRARRKVQEENKGLHGKKYLARQEEANAVRELFSIVR